MNYFVTRETTKMFLGVMILLSADVAKMLEKLNEFESGAKHEAVSRLKGIAEEDKTCEKDRQALAAIAGVLSMSYTESEGGYTPMIELSNGARSFSVEDLNEKTITILKDALQVKCPAWARAQIADVLWIKENDHTYAELAALGFVEEFCLAFNPEHWVACFDLIHRAYCIAVSLGKNGFVVKQVRAEVNKFLDKMNGMDPWFLSLNLIELVGSDATGEEARRYYEIAEKIFSRNIDAGSDNMTLLDAALERSTQLLKRLKRDNEIPAMRAKLAVHYEHLADRFLNNQPAGVYHAIHILQQACRLYSPKMDRKKILEIRKRIEELQCVAANGMQGQSFKFDATKIYDSVKADFEGLSLREMIVQLGETAAVYDVESIRARVIESTGSFFSTFLCSRHIVDENGHTVEIIPPLDIRNPESQPEVIRKHMAQHLTRVYSLEGAITLRYALSMLKDMGPISVADLDFLIDKNPIVPAGRNAIIKIGIQLGLSGEVYAAMHILLPQMEHIIRGLVAICGDTTSFLKEDGCEEYKSLSQLFQSNELRECYDENILFALQVLMDDRAGANLRNLNAHGLLEPRNGNGGSALCFLGLVIKLLSFYSNEARDIASRLISREKEQD